MSMTTALTSGPSFFAKKFTEDFYMARVSVEDCLDAVPNRFVLVRLAARRVRQLLKGSDPLVECTNKEVVTALREIAACKVGIKNLKEVTGVGENRDPGLDRK